jgi:hypothetical protein
LSGRSGYVTSRSVEAAGGPRDGKLLVDQKSGPEPTMQSDGGPRRRIENQGMGSFGRPELVWRDAEGSRGAVPRRLDAQRKDRVCGPELGRKVAEAALRRRRENLA